MIRALLSFLFPNLCVHCEEDLAQHSAFFCENCFRLCELSFVEKRAKVVTVFEGVGPALSLKKALKDFHKIQHVQLFASLVVLQLHKRGDLDFDWIVSSSHKADRKLSQELSKLLSIPILSKKGDALALLDKKILAPCWHPPINTASFLDLPQATTLAFIFER